MEPAGLQVDDVTSPSARIGVQSESKGLRTSRPGRFMTWV
jgi:hypothetical protein